MIRTLDASMLNLSHSIRELAPLAAACGIQAISATAEVVDDEGAGQAGVAFDTFHWYTSGGASQDDLILMAQHPERLVAVHLNDAVARVPFDRQQDMVRRLPLETGVIDTRRVLACLRARENDALYMIEPFEPSRSRFHELSAEAAVREVAGIFERLER